MKRHYEIDIPDVESIRQQAIAIIGSAYLDSPKTVFAYLPDSKKLFLGIPELKSFLDNKGWTDSVTGIMLNVIPAGNTSTIHIDAPIFSRSFNIPLQGYEQSYVDFFEELKQPEFIDKPKSDISGSYKFSTYQRQDVELVERYQTTGPYILRTDIPHQVINEGKSNRSILLVRLSTQLDMGEYDI
jgi:hypothetical protein